ncbi:geobacillin-26 family protein [Fictibacillus aquaticus]|uniref:Uncharacterized protein n=1 Tax=Fictibacillus aquaticus TaxID=2021314 RepID=A0A235F6M5_9BACL|nr:geobacillin-26 family protein [Fictibacillus aquaticus]OYD56335.1 hypothetical protein CGZ90_17995 [Fictibacillus aquaticus]
MYRKWVTVLVVIAWVAFGVYLIPANSTSEEIGDKELIQSDKDFWHGLYYKVHITEQKIVWNLSIENEQKKTLVEKQENKKKLAEFREKVNETQSSQKFAFINFSGIIILFIILSLYRKTLFKEKKQKNFLFFIISLFVFYHLFDGGKELREASNASKDAIRIFHVLSQPD